jgi:hypothetical protein
MIKVHQTYKMDLLCLKCGREGCAMYDDGQLISTDDKFYICVSRRLEGPPQLVCARCGPFTKMPSIHIVRPFFASGGRTRRVTSRRVDGDRLRLEEARNTCLIVEHPKLSHL